MEAASSLTVQRRVNPLSSSRKRGITVIPVTGHLDDSEWRRHTRHGLELLADHRVRPAIGHQVPLIHAAQAHQAMADRTVIGKTLLTV
jgi:NADPH:quinone reductase